MFQNVAVEKIKTQILSSINFPSENRAFCERMSKNILVPGRPQLILRMRIACWITKATDTHTHTEYVILIDCPMFIRTPLNVPFVRTFPLSLCLKASWG